MSAMEDDLLDRFCQRLGWLIALACLVLWFIAAREPVLNITFLRDLEASAAVVFGIPVLLLAQSVLITSSSHFLRQRAAKSWSDRFPFATLPWARQTRPHSTWMLLFLFYGFPLLTLADLLVVMNQLHIVSYSGNYVAKDLAGWELYFYPGLLSGEDWRWCVVECQKGDAIQNVRRSAYPGLQPIAYVLLSLGLVVQTAYFMVRSQRIYR